jgi:hypothetical protein
MLREVEREALSREWSRTSKVQNAERAATLAANEGRSIAPRYGVALEKP